MENKHTQELAEKIALLVQEQKEAESESLRQTLENINRRLSQIESSINLQSVGLNPPVVHPSQEKLLLIENFVDEIIVNHKIEKACIFEPKKPCDKCSMCDSRGF